jgi:hypothetical protein
LSFRDIGAITNKVKLQAERERGHAVEDTQPKSDESRVFKMFSHGKSITEVVIALDLPNHYVQRKHQEYWECKHMFKLAQIYEEAKYDLQDLFRSHRIFKQLGINKQALLIFIKAVFVAMYIMRTFHQISI